MPDAVDLRNLPRFLEHLEPRDPSAAALARQLLDAGATVRGFWGPEQMDVWELKLQRGEMIVRFGIERGVSDSALAAPASTAATWGDLCSLDVATLAWARARAVPLAFDDLDDFDVDVSLYGIDVVDWLDDGHFGDAQRVNRAWREYRKRESRVRSRTRGNPSAQQRADLRAFGVAIIEAAARPSTE